jgi:hypothetical protein
MNPIVLAFFIACTNPPDANGNLAADCLEKACPNVTHEISSYIAQNKQSKLSKDDKLDLGKMLVWHSKNCAGRG